MIGTVQCGYSLNRNHIRAGTGDPSASLSQEFRQVPNFRLFCGVLNHRRAVGETGRHHDVFGACDRGRIEIYPIPFQSACSRSNVPVLNLNLGS